MKTGQIIINNITKKFPQGDGFYEVLKGISTIFEHNKTYALSGASGSGKSTLIHLLAGLDTPTTGTIEVNGSDIKSLTSTEKQKLLNKTFGLVFQQPYLIAELSVLENVMIKGLIAGFNQTTSKTKAKELLEQVGLISKRNSHPATLSGGQQQRVAIARAIFNEPFFLLADEPTGNLDEETGIKIIDLLLECNKQWGMGIIVSSHDAYVTQKMETVLKLHDGELSFSSAAIKA